MAKQSLNTFLSAVASVAPRVAPNYGLTAQELQLTLIVAAGLEGGLGETTAVGDGGLSHGRFQFYTGGGHGNTLLNQGWTINDFYDDWKVVEHWAPVLAGALATMKQKGFKGGEAIRQAIFAAERPRDMYPMERFNSVMTHASSLMGGLPALVETDSSGVSGMSNVDPRYNALVKAYNAALDAWIKSGKPAYEYDEFGNEVETPEYAAYQNAYQALRDYIEVFGKPDDPDTGLDAAQRAFENQIRLEELEETRASNAFTRWLEKQNQARTNAVDEINDIRESNAKRLETQLLREQSGTPGLIHRAVGPYRLEKPYEEVLAKWKEKLGVDDMPPEPEPVDIPLPDTTGGGHTAGAQGPVGVAGAETYGIDFTDPGTWVDPGGKGAPTKPPMPVSTGVQGIDFTDPGTWWSGPTKPMSSKAVSNPFASPSLMAKSTADKLKKKADQLAWWKNPLPKFKNGVRNFAGGEAIVGEAGPEIIQVPGLGEFTVTEPSVKNLPPGSNVIPVDQAFVMHQIQQAFQQERSGGGQMNPANTERAKREQFARANDPNLQEKVKEAIVRAIAADYAANPPGAPIITDPRVKDRWAIWRPLHDDQQAAMQQQPVQGVPR